MQITALATQGRYGSSDWQTAYQLIFSDTGHNWKQYRWEGRAFPGNTNADSVVQHKLQDVIARFVRLVPLKWNPNGRIGLRLEAYGCTYSSNTVSFDGDSSLFLKSIRKPRQTSSDNMYLKFKTLKNSGILFHAEGQNELSFTVELQKGQLLLLLRKGKTLNNYSLNPNVHHLVSLGSLLDDQHWHHVAVEHHSSMHPLLKNNIPPMHNFQGCLENLFYDGLNVIDLAKQRDQRVTLMVKRLPECLCHGLSYF
uniref:Contactin associated protein like 3 n=1 Tax=Cyprinodon variegatus TaxID=28743 RepID=A0A3Q2GCT9_CYPVA